MRNQSGTPAFAGVAEQARMVRAGELSARELTGYVLARIERLEPRLNAFTRVLHDEALAEARARDEEQAAGAEPGPLHGVPIAIKDEVHVAGSPTTYGGASATKPVPADAELVRRLRAAGAVIVGKTAMPEFGLWPFTESAAHGYTRNPWDPARSPGGSSGGSAAAVAAGVVAAAIGGDGGGSIRIPAAYCGLFGLKPQRGRVSAAPNGDLWRALGTAGPLTRTVADSALIYDAVRGAVDTDRWRAGEPSMSFTDAAATTPRPMRIAVSLKSAQLGTRPDREVVDALRATAHALADLGHDVEEADPAYPEIAPSFMPQLLRGVREEADRVDRPDLLEHRTRQLVALSRLLAPEPVARWAEARGERIAAVTNQIFDRYDLLLTPTMARLPPRLGRLDGAGLLRAITRSLPPTAYTAIWNVCGNPAAAIPAGWSRAGLPLSVQLVGRPYGEPGILQVAAQLEQARPWAGRRPPL